jgi:hypothetical protein
VSEGKIPDAWTRQVSDDDIKVTLALIKLGTITGEMENKIAFTLWRKGYIVWVKVSETPQKTILTITEDGEKFLSS